MCGINGQLSLDGSPLDPARLTRMRDSMAHRGPDGAGLWLSPDARVGLGHRRLAVIDLSPEAGQPMSDGTRVLTYNGEIYNHRELRRQLSHRAWKTDHSDTEVLLHAYAEWGIEALQRLRGMFAFALWDGSRLVLARDRLGIKPLYHQQDSTRFRFASEIKALLADPEVPRGLNQNALGHYLSFLTTPAPHTLFAGISKLPAGHWMTVDLHGNQMCRRYWDARRNARDLCGRSDAELAEELREELALAVRMHQVSDVPVGIFLSGGIDSSTNAALFSRDRPVKTFTVGYRGEYQTYRNELHFARQMAERIGAEHHERLLTLDDLVSFLPRMIELQDEPLGDPVCMPVYFVSQLAREHGVVVCQVGEGSDELFWGYPSWRAKLWLARANRGPVPMPLKRLLLRLLGPWEDSAPYEALRRATQGQPIFWGGAEAFTETQKRKLLRIPYEPGWEAVRPIWERFDQSGLLNWMSYLDLNFRLPELLLMRVDKMSMGVSLEARVPFLDHHVVELAMGVGEAARTRGNQLKSLLKRAVRGLIPDALIDRPKQGFGVPVTEWLTERLGPVAEQTVLDFCARTELLNADYVRSLRGPKERWTLLNLALWHAHWIEGRALELQAA